jgi:hypothetical protein
LKAEERVLIMKMTEQMRDELKSLLEQHQATTDALRHAGKAVLFVSGDSDDDFIEVPLTPANAGRVLTEQTDWIEKELADKFGISVSRETVAHPIRVSPPSREIWTPGANGGRVGHVHHLPADRVRESKNRP